MSFDLPTYGPRFPVSIVVVCRIGYLKNDHNFYRASKIDFYIFVYIITLITIKDSDF